MEDDTSMDTRYALPERAAAAASMARETITSLLAGTPAPAPLPERLDGWRETVETLQAALAEGGKDTVHAAWQALCRGRPELASLVPPAREPVLARMADVEPEEVKWLWKPSTPVGKLTILEGDPGTGKTWLALAITAATSRGAPWPGQQTRRDPMTVLYLSA